MMRPCQGLHVVCVMIATLATADVARADGGTVRLSEVFGGCRVTAFTSPTPLRVGQADVSVLVADPESDRPMSSADVHVRIRPVGQTWRAWQPVTFEAATNKLFRMATIDLSHAGTWEAELRIDGPGGRAATRFTFEVDPPLPRWLDLAAWIFWPIVPIALFAVREVARGQRRSPAPFPARRV